MPVYTYYGEAARIIAAAKTHARLSFPHTEQVIAPRLEALGLKPRRKLEWAGNRGILYFESQAREGGSCVVPLLDIWEEITQASQLARVTVHARIRASLNSDELRTACSTSSMLPDLFAVLGPLIPFSKDDTHILMTSADARQLARKTISRMKALTEFLLLEEKDQT